MIDLMIDIETLGQGPGCVITSVALVPFNLNGKPLEDSTPFQIQLHIGEQLAEGYTMNMDTLEWWLNNSLEVRRSTFGGVGWLSELTTELVEYIQQIEKEYKTYRLWATSAKMDYGCIHYTFAKQGKPYPFNHTAEHCARTVRNLTKMLVPGYKLDADKGRNHDAIRDCITQIDQLQKQYQALRKLSQYGVEVDKLIAENKIN